MSTTHPPLMYASTHTSTHTSAGEPGVNIQLIKKFSGGLTTTPDQTTWPLNWPST